MSADDELSDLAAQLGNIAESLADVAIDLLRAATDPDDPDPKAAAALERRVTRARRAVERAVAILDDGAAAEDP
jgi:hypothetical protein